MNAPATIPTQYGLYVPLSERLPEFDQAYPLKDGWQVEIEVKDTFSMRPEFSAFLKECVRNNVSFQEHGIKLPNQQSYVFVAKLVNPDGKVVRTASTHQVIEYLKDYERAETRARQRLVAVCGFDGGVLDEDESLAQEIDEDALDESSLSSEHEQPSEQEIDDLTGSLPNEIDREPVLPSAVNNQLKTLRQQMKDRGRELPVLPTTVDDALKQIRDIREELSK